MHRLRVHQKLRRARIAHYRSQDYNQKRWRTHDIEIDFLISNNSKIKYKVYPIEVKSGKNYTTKSLMRFRESYKQRMGGAYIIHPKNLFIKDDIICIPPYMTICL